MAPLAAPGELLPTLVLPGLHGGTDQLDEFARLAPEPFQPILLSLPESTADYDQLTEHFAEIVAQHPACALVAESFSGPLAVKLAARLPERVKLLVLVATFARAPRPLLVRWLPWRWLFRLPLPMWAMRLFLTGREMSADRAARLRADIRQMSARMFAARFREISRVDVRAELARIQAHRVYLQGANDWIVPASAAADFASASPPWPVIRVPGGHMLLEAQPAACWDALAKVFGGASGS